MRTRNPPPPLLAKHKYMYSTFLGLSHHYKKISAQTNFFFTKHYYSLSILITSNVLGFIFQKTLILHSIFLISHYFFITRVACYLVYSHYLVTPVSYHKTDGILYFVYNPPVTSNVGL